MAGRYLNKNNLLEFCKRFTTSEFQQYLNFNKQNAENNKSVQKVSDFWQLIGWNYYYKQLQARMERLVDDVELGFQALGRKVPTPGKQSLRQAKRNVQQLMLQSKQRFRQLERDIVRIRDKLPHREATKHATRKVEYQNIETITMMEEGKLAKNRSQLIFDTKGDMHDFLFQSNGQTTLTHESTSATKSIDEAKPTQVKANIQKPTKQTLEVDKKLSNDSSVTDSAVSLRVADADIPRSLMLSAEKSN
ncbi:uncharacterized protein LOC105227313 [Bactrocera dorsalis]|uniref:Uncharacterized protein LOC105227313 n=1 Tax=Bactrocera dorsalis TaxID=27457 RepID=A0A6I9V640_BACDO|nr:uncharacterized protein LOC105227313 [Bactrocera dorsalis]